jgi:hypothetical protein
VSGFKARGIQFYSNDANVAVVACEFSGATHLVRGVDIDGVVVRATAGNNRLTGFRIAGANLDLPTCQVRRVIWENFDYPGQARFDGVAFARVENDGELFVADPRTLTLRRRTGGKSGNRVPLRMRGKGSTSGEWIAAQIPAGGISISTGGLAPNRRYYCYLYDDNGATRLNLSAVPFEADPKTGYAVKSGDATQFYVGSVETDSAATFKTQASGWLNPLHVPGTYPGRTTRIWTDASGQLRSLYDADPRSDTDGKAVTRL